VVVRAGRAERVAERRDSHPIVLLERFLSTWASSECRSERQDAARGRQAFASRRPTIMVAAAMGRDAINTRSDEPTAADQGLRPPLAVGATTASKAER